MNAVDSANRQDYYSSRSQELLALLEDHAQAWLPFLARAYGDACAETIVKQARAHYETLIPQIPYIGGDDNPMTRHLIRSTTSLALYKAMKAQGKSAQETGEILYRAVVERVSELPVKEGRPLTEGEVRAKEEEARRSQERRYSGDWVWAFVQGDGETFNYGYDFIECGTQKLYHAHGAGEFLPDYCYLDFVTTGWSGWGLTRTMTLGEGYPKCDSRYTLGGPSEHRWPPPFVDPAR